MHWRSIKDTTLEGETWFEAFGPEQRAQWAHLLHLSHFQPFLFLYFRLTWTPRSVLELNQWIQVKNRLHMEYMQVFILADIGIWRKGLWVEYTQYFESCGSFTHLLSISLILYLPASWSLVKYGTVTLTVLSNLESSVKYHIDLVQEQDHINFNH